MTTAPHDSDAPAIDGRLVVTAGGEPGADELAAVALALAGLPGRRRVAPVVPAWTAAAIQEGVGERRIAAPDALGGRRSSVT